MSAFEFFWKRWRNCWAPSLAEASPEARERYTIGWDGALLVWDPDDGEINEDLLVAHYLRGGIEQV